jgi:hypothetical protein
MSQNDHNAGGGSGGGVADPGSLTHAVDGAFTVEANQVQLVSRPPLPPAIPGPHKITVLAAGMTLDGQVDVGASKGVRITAGPQELPPTASDSTNGVEAIVGELQNITLQRGLIDGVDQKILMAPGSITIDGGAGTITIQSLTEITLSVAGGLSTITLTPAGIKIQGILVQIN